MLRISFFSYKGGAGRSSIAYNVIPFLAKELKATEENPIIIVDMDLDSAGMTYLVDKISEQKTDKNFRAQELLSGRIPGSSDSPDEVSISEHPLFSNLNKIGNEFGFNEDASILFMPAKPGASLNAGDSYDKGGINPLVIFSKLCKQYKCKAIIFDTPAGDQLAARWSLDVSDVVACCMRITYQFRRGTIDFLSRKDKEYEGKEYILVPNAVPTDEIIIDGSIYDLNAVKNEILERTGSGMFRNNNVNVQMLEEGYFGVPEVKRFKFEEGILYTAKEVADDERVALDCYERLAKIISTPQE